WAGSACTAGSPSTGERMSRSLFLLAICACVPRTKIVVPPEAAQWAYDDAHTQRHVIRMSDGSRDWEVEFPDVAVGYEVRIPLRGAPAAGTGDARLPTRLPAADRELLEERALGPCAQSRAGCEDRTPSADRAAGTDHATQPAAAATAKKTEPKRSRA